MIRNIKSAATIAEHGVRIGSLAILCSWGKLCKLHMYDLTLFNCCLIGVLAVIK